MCERFQLVPWLGTQHWLTMPGVSTLYASY
uniref:Uncharacterized protein n=1 Tax=Podoviridae sp. ct2iq11 TaxID=2827720 RepID=A0A8S5TPI6_9CAUD|nr:MAG TPA: hypothetical protein [Podoviridae sp. ct2iq11]